MLLKRKTIVPCSCLINNCWRDVISPFFLSMKQVVRYPWLEVAAADKDFPQMQYCLRGDHGMLGLALPSNECTLRPSIINISGNAILRQLLQEIQTADWYSVIADEPTDVSHNEQMCIAIRWVDSSYAIHEATLGLVQLPDTKALTLFGFICL